MSSRDLELLILLLVHHDSMMSTKDLVMKVAQARNMKLPSGRVYDLAYGDVVKEVRKAKKALRDKGLVKFLNRGGDPRMLPAGHSLVEKMRGLLEES